MTIDPLAPLVDLPGVREAADRARDALGAVHRHPVNLRNWDKAATEASWRAGRSSAAIDGGSVELRRDGDFDDPLLAGAMRVAQALDGDALNQMTAVFRRAPAQALARLHMLAAADLVDDEEALGRPRPGGEVAARLDLLGQLITGATSAPAPVLAAVVHGELLGVRAFETANGIVARAASRLVSTSSGLDPHNLGVPEVTWFKRSGITAGYRRPSPPEILTGCVSGYSSAARPSRRVRVRQHPLPTPRASSNICKVLSPWTVGHKKIAGGLLTV